MFTSVLLFTVILPTEPVTLIFTFDVESTIISSTSPVTTRSRFISRLSIMSCFSFLSFERTTLPAAHVSFMELPFACSSQVFFAIDFTVMLLNFP